PPHNLTEVIDGTIHLVDKPITKEVEKDAKKYKAAVKELMKHITAPDFPTGGIIYGYEPVIEAYMTGRGRVIMRAVAGIEEQKNGRLSIVVTEIPFQVNKATLIENIAQLVRDKKIEDR